MDVLEAGKDTRELFRIEVSADGYFAVRDTSPRFALLGKTIADASAKAERALALVARVHLDNGAV